MFKKIYYKTVHQPRPEKFSDHIVPCYYCVGFHMGWELLFLSASNQAALTRDAFTYSLHTPHTFLPPVGRTRRGVIKLPSPSRWSTEIRMRILKSCYNFNLKCSSNTLWWIGRKNLTVKVNESVGY